MSRTAVFFVAFVLASMTMASTASSAPDEKAESALERGYRLMARGKFEDALDAFLVAHQQSPSPRTAVQIGFAELGIGRWANAEDHLTEGLQQRDDKWIQKNEPQIQEALKKVDAHIARVLVRGPEGGRVSINGEPRGMLPLRSPLRCPAGLVTVKVRALDSLPFTEEISTKEGRTVEVTAVLMPEPARLNAVPGPSLPPPAAILSPVKEPQVESSTSVWVGASLTVAGAASLAAGAYYLGLDGKPTCDGPPSNVCPMRFNGALPGYALGGAGVVAAGIGVVLLVSAATPRSGAHPVSMNLGPGSMSLGGRF